jgi:hypothetical protein
MSRWWLTYNRRDRLHGVVIVEAASLISACVGVADSALDKDVSFVEGHDLMLSGSDGSPQLCRDDALSQRGRTASQEDLEGRWQKAVDAVTGALSSLATANRPSRYYFFLPEPKAGCHPPVFMLGAATMVLIFSFLGFLASRLPFCLPLAMLISLWV